MLTLQPLLLSPLTHHVCCCLSPVTVCTGALPAGQAEPQRDLQHGAERAQQRSHHDGRRQPAGVHRAPQAPVGAVVSARSRASGGRQQRRRQRRGAVRVQLVEGTACMGCWPCRGANAGTQAPVDAVMSGRAQAAAAAATRRSQGAAGGGRGLHGLSALGRGKGSSTVAPVCAVVSASSRASGCRQQQSRGVSCSACSRVRARPAWVVGFGEGQRQWQKCWGAWQC